MTIQDELTKIKEQIAKLEQSLEDKPDYGLGQGDPAIVRWEMNHALLEQSRERAASLEQALSRINKGTYGICERCGQPIHPDRLAVLPGVTTCIRCARGEQHKRTQQRE
ncbi:MAG: TraR/DksA C4-type zinc finger protein [Anaerolineae bacterium]|nr:TraR/DksA C4-type zinc finger protein [Anaerolineae bacterium]